MKKEKFTLDTLKVQSFVTTLEEAQMGHVKGGQVAVKGRHYTYHTRWTSVDTRADSTSAINRPFLKGNG